MFSSSSSSWSRPTSGVIATCAGGRPSALTATQTHTGSCAAPDLDGADVVDLDAPERQPVHAGADQDLSRVGHLLEARGEIDRLAGGERGVAGAGDDLPRLDPDARLKLEVLDRVEDLQRGADGALGVVLVRRRDAERGHHGVARELLDGAAVGLDTARDAVEELGHAPAHDLGVACGDQRRRVDEVDEQDRGEFSLHRSKCMNERDRV